MKYFKIKNILLSMLTFSLCGCLQGLDLVPQNAISDATYWNTVDEFKTGANNLYISLPGFSYFDVDSDIAFNTPNNIRNSTSLVPYTDGNWNTPYANIRNCNNILEKAKNSDLGEPINVYVAEALFFRAYNYWRLFRLYGGVPLIKKTLDIASPELYQKRNSRKETIDFIIQDLQEAIQRGLPLESNIPDADKGRISEGAAYALMARVALFEGTWAKYRGRTDANEYLDIAIGAADKVIQSKQYFLFKGKAADSYRYLFIDEGDNCSECILDRRYEYNVVPHDYPTRYQADGLLPTKKLADMYLCSDGLPIDKSSLFKGYDKIDSEFQNRDPRMSMTMMMPGKLAYHPGNLSPVINWPYSPQRNANTGYILFKYMSENPLSLMEGMNSTKGYGYDRHEIRYAEVLLIYAEATYERYDDISNEVLNQTINLLRERAGLKTALTKEFVSANNLDMRDEIRRERTVELALEGYRWDDLRRWKIAEKELVQEVKGIKITGDWARQDVAAGNIYYSADWQNKADSDGFLLVESASNRNGFDPEKHYLKPIPAKEIQMNRNLEQNPNW